MFLGLQTAACQRVVRFLFACTQQGNQRTAGGCILDDSAPRFGETDHLAHPVGDHLLQLGQGRARLPGQPQHAQACAEVISQHRRELAVAWKISEEVGMLKMGKARDNDLLEIAEDALKRFRLLRRCGWKLGTHRARLHTAIGPVVPPCGNDNRRSSRSVGGHIYEILQGSWDSSCVVEARLFNILVNGIGAAAHPLTCPSTGFSPVLSYAPLLYFPGVPEQNIRTIDGSDIAADRGCSIR